MIDSLNIDYGIDERLSYDENETQLIKLDNNHDNNATPIFPSNNNAVRQSAKVDAVLLNESIERSEDSDLTKIAHKSKEIKQEIVIEDADARKSLFTSSTTTQQAQRRRSTMKIRNRFSMIHVINKTSNNYHDSCISSCTFDTGSSLDFDESYNMIGGQNDDDKAESRFVVCFSDHNNNDTEKDYNTNKRNGPIQPRRRSTLSTGFNVIDTNNNDET